MLASRCERDENGRLTNVRVIAFDADDTLWVNETFFRETEERFCDLVEPFISRGEALKCLFATEMRNLQSYGFGIKPFTLSLIEAAIEVSGGRLPTEIVQQLILLGKQMLHKPVELLPHVEETLATLSHRFRLVVVTKGDLLDQERKLMKSGLETYFHHIEIVSDKTPQQFRKLTSHLDIHAQELAMVGNSLKSDILPVLDIGAFGFHIPFHTTWAHELAEVPVDHPNFRSLQSMREILQYV